MTHSHSTTPVRQRELPELVQATATPAGADVAVSRRSSGDPIFAGAVLTLLVVGLLAVYSSSAAVSLSRFGSPHHHVLRHLAHLAIGVPLMLVLWRLDYRRFDRSAVVHGAWALVLVALVFTLFQDPAGGARRWIRFGTWSLQASELAKLAVVLLAAFQLSRRSDRLADPWRGLLPPMVLTSLVAMLVALQPDFGTASMLLALLGLLAFVAGTPLTVLACFGLTGAAVLAVHVVQEPYRVERLQSFLDPFADPLGAGFQLRQSLIALGSGGFTGNSSEGLLGTGLGCSVQKLFFLPEPHTDFVYAIVGEELGLLGTLTVLALFVLVLARGFRVAAHAPDSFGTLLAAGATAVIAFQGLANMLVVTGLLPTKGLSLPFLSAGGSSLCASCAAAGLVLSVSRHDA